MTRNVPSETAKFAAVAENLAAARGFIRRFLSSANWNGRDLDVLIAVGEVLQNIVRHGFAGGNADGSIHIKLSIEMGILTVLIEDDAPPSLPSGWSTSGRQASDGGLGLNIIRRIAAEVEFSPTATGNRAHLRFRPE